jgi:hypothetical protein
MTGGILSLHSAPQDQSEAMPAFAIRYSLFGIRILRKHRCKADKPICSKFTVSVYPG